MPRCFVLLCALAFCACCGTPDTEPRDPDPTPKPPTDAQAPVVEEPEAPTEEAPTPDEPGDEPPADVAVFVTEEGQCAWSVVQPGSEDPPQPIATLPIPCHENTLLGPSPRGDKVAVMMGEGLFEVDLRAHTATAVPGLAGLPGSLEAWGYREDGTRVALAQGTSEAVVDAENETAHYAVDGERIPISWDDYQYAPFIMLCLRYVWRDGGWRREAAEAVSMGEGVSPPFCAYNGEGWDIPLIEVHQGGGHGYFDLVSIPEAKQTPALGKFSIGEYQNWGSLDLGIAHYAMAYDELEGQHFAPPLLIWRDGDWRAVEGLNERGSLSLSWGEDVFIGCSGERAGVYAKASGARLWSGHTPCPVWWPLTPNR